MEVADPFSPTYTNGHTESYDEFVASPSVEPFYAAEPQPEPQPETLPEPQAEHGVAAVSEGIDQAKQFAAQLTETLNQLSQALGTAESERAALHDERRQLGDRMVLLEGAAARKEQFRNVFLQGSGSELSEADLQSLQGVTDALTADPDRLTTLFAVVQQAPKLAAVVRVCSELRAMVEAE